jgi:hypothetical protein
VNASYDGVDTALRDRFMRTGGQSGKFGRATMQTELGRMRDLNSLEGQFAGLQLDDERSTMGLAERLLSFGQGSESTQTAPGNVAGSTLGSIGDSMGQMATLMTLDRILRGGK